MILTINARQLKKAFEEISPLVKKSEMSKSVAFNYIDDYLIVTADAGISYQRRLDVSSAVDAVNTGITVYFSDISSLLPSKGTVDIEITKFSINISAEDLETSLIVSDSIITPFKTTNTKGVNLSMNIINTAVNKLNSIGAIKKSLMTERPLLFSGDYVYVKYTTIWIRCKSMVLNCMLSSEDAKRMIDFEPTEVVIGDALEFKKENAVLRIPNSVSVNEHNFEDKENSLEKITTIETEGLASTVQKLIASMDAKPCKVFLYESGIEISVNTQRSSISKRVNVYGKVISSFETRLDYLLMCLNLLGDLGAEVKRKDNVLCLKNSLVTILISVD